MHYFSVHRADFDDYIKKLSSHRFTRKRMWLSLDKIKKEIKRCNGLRYYSVSDHDLKVELFSMNIIDKIIYNCSTTRTMVDM